jgi:hypothetical protein
LALPTNCWKILFVTSMNSSIPARRWRVSWISSARAADAAVSPRTVVVALKI